VWLPYLSPVKASPFLNQLPDDFFENFPKFGEKKPIGLNKFFHSIAEGNETIMEIFSTWKENIFRIFKFMLKTLFL